MADVKAVDFHQRKREAHYEAVEPGAARIERHRYAGGTGSFPLIGRPETIAEKIVQIHRLGFAGATLSFVNFNEELPYFVERVLPLLRQAGLREDAVKVGGPLSTTANEVAAG
jgi:alkanesulfonate monooxygenase SsuD/methylene tetrahydromethanopterin reductase-like flavin-dependent oxidoreductase (luciferase family)